MIVPVAAMLFVAACSAPEERVASPGSPSPSTPEPEPRKSSPDRKIRYVSVARAVARLKRHVDVPVVLPRDRLAGIRNDRWWQANLEHVLWSRRGGRRLGVLQLRRRDEILWISYGYASPDGCGGRDTAVPTWSAVVLRCCGRTRGSGVS